MAQRRLSENVRHHLGNLLTALTMLWILFALIALADLLFSSFYRAQGIQCHLALVFFDIALSIAA